MPARGTTSLPLKAASWVGAAVHQLAGFASVPVHGPPARREGVRQDLASGREQNLVFGFVLSRLVSIHAGDSANVGGPTHMGVQPARIVLAVLFR